MTQREFLMFAALDWPAIRSILFSTKGMSFARARVLKENVLRALVEYGRHNTKLDSVKLTAIGHISLLEKWVRRNWIQKELRRRITRNVAYAKLEPRTVKQELGKEFEAWWKPGDY